jgi:hypothetical protein
VVSLTTCIAISGKWHYTQKKSILKYYQEKQFQLLNVFFIRYKKSLFITGNSMARIISSSDIMPHNKHTSTEQVLPKQTARKHRYL